jgi:hypothetical protein
MILNFIIPGSGTMLSAFPKFAEFPSENPEFNCNVFIDGVLQMYLSVLIVGYFWSCWAGYAIFKKRTSLNLPN